MYNMGMKTFKYKFTKLNTALIIAGIALCVVGFTINLVQCIKYGTASSA